MVRSSALRLLLIGVVAVALGLGPGSANAHAAAVDPDHPLALALASAEAEYPTGADVRLTATVTNNGGAACGVAASAEGSLRIQQVTRDGVVLQPVTGVSLLLAGLDVGVAGAAVPTAPGAAQVVPIDLRTPDGLSGQLRQYDTLPTGEGITSSWEIAEPGRYEVTALWAPPGTVNDALVQAASGNPAEDPDACLGPSRITTVAFTVTAAASGWAWWWWLVVAAAVLLVLGLLVLLLRRSRRRGRALGAAVVLLAATGVLVSPPTAARAEISGIGGVGGALSGCLSTFAQPGMDPAGTIAALNAPGAPPVRVQQVSVPSWGLGTETNRVDPTDVSKGAIISWDPTHNIFLDNAVFTPCLALYHELTHAVDMSEGVDSLDGDCNGVPISDIHTVAAENLLRPKLGLGPRTQYHGVPIPDLTYEECKADRDKRKRAEELGLPPGPDGDGGAPPGGAPAGGGGGSGTNGSGSGGGGGGDDGSGSNGGGSGGGNPDGGNGGLGGGGGGGGGIFGDPHLATLDGLLYDLQSVGEFVALRVPDGPEVQIRTTPVAGSDVASMVSAVAVRAGSTRLGFYADDGALTLRRDGAAVPTTAEPIDLGGAVLQRIPAAAAFSGYGWTVTWPDGSVVELQNSAGWAIKLSVRLADDLQRSPVGLLGNFDGDPNNDLRTRGGDTVPDARTAAVQPIRAFGDSWRLTDDETLFDYAAGRSTTSFTDLTFPRSGVDPSAEAMQNAQRACDLAGVHTEPLRSTCLYDLLAGGQPGLVVQTAQVALEHPGLVGPGSPGVVEPSAPSSSAGAGGSVSAPAAPPDATVENGLQPGSSRFGTVTADAPLRLEFEATAGQVAYFRATGGCDPADTSLIWTVREVSGQFGEYHGTVGSCADVGRTSFTLDGTYALEFIGAGSYAFIWEPVAPDVVQELPADGVGAGELTAPTARHVFTFDAEAGSPVTFTPAADCPAGTGATWYVLDEANNFDGRGVYDLCQVMGPLDLPTGRFQLILLSVQDPVPYRFTRTG